MPPARDAVAVARSWARWLPRLLPTNIMRLYKHRIGELYNSVMAEQQRKETGCLSLPNSFPEKRTGQRKAADFTLLTIPTMRTEEKRGPPPLLPYSARSLWGSRVFASQTIFHCSPSSAPHLPCLHILWPGNKITWRKGTV